MPIGFRCTGCRSRLHVPKRWAGNTIPCPKCGTRVVVPATALEGAAEAEPTAFEDAALERSLASLEPPRPAVAGGSFSDEAFVVPDPLDALSVGQPQGRGSITLSRRTIYAYGIMMLLVAVMSFLLGCWWTATVGR